MENHTETSPTAGRPPVPGSVEFDTCSRKDWYGEKGKSLRRIGWRLRQDGPKWDAENALIERAMEGTSQWREHGIDLIANINEQIQRTRELGRDAANDGDPQTAWYADKMIVQLEKWKAETEATLAKHPPNAKALPLAGRNQ